MTSLRQQPSRTLRRGILLSLVVHVVILVPVAWFTARRRALPPASSSIAVRLMSEAASEPPPAGPASQPATATARAASGPVELAPPVAVASPVSEAPGSRPVAVASADPPGPPASVVTAPPPVQMPALAFDDGLKTVQTTGDALAVYRGFVEFSVRAGWDRPTGIEDARYVAEVDVEIDSAGALRHARWRRRSGNAPWDASVMDAVQRTPRLSRPPPRGFPGSLTVRFDVVSSPEAVMP